MPNTAKVEFNITNLSFSVASILKGISGVSGVTKRGPFAKTDLLVTTWEQFTKLYGGYISNSDFPLLCKRAFDRGAQLRVNRQGHYTTITDASTLDAVKAGLNGQTITFDAALITANVYNVTVNGTAIAPVTFATNSDTTMAAIATALEAISAYVQDAYVVNITGSVSDDRVIVVLPKTGVTLNLTGSAVTLGASQANAVVATLSNTSAVNTAGQSIFKLRPKYEGVDYNNTYYVISDASNGNANYFNLAVKHSVESGLDETYQNLTITGTPNITNSTYLDSVKLGSALVDVTYLDLSSGFTAPVRPKNATYYFTAGSDGTAPLAADYVGDSAGANGFYSFDAVDDMIQIAAPEISATAVHLGGGAYAEARKDLMYLAHLSNSLTTAANIISDRAATNIDSYYTAFYGGGLKIVDPTTSQEKTISELGDVLGIIANSDFTAGEWFSYAGSNRGAIPNVIGVVNNFGSPAKFNDLNSLANRQINMVIQRNNEVFLSGNFSGVLSNSKLSFVNVVRFLIFLQKSLSPTLNQFIEEPNDIPTFKSIFRAVEPFLDSLVTRRALFDYDWQGDQNISDISQVVINNPTDLDNGIYKVRLFVKIIPTMQNLKIDIVVAPTGISFEALA